MQYSRGISTLKTAARSRPRDCYIDETVPRSLSTRLLLAVLLAAGLPFAAFVYFVADFVESRITTENVEFYLQSKAGDVADKINAIILERQRDLEIWSTERTAVAALRPPPAGAGPEFDDATMDNLQNTLNLFCKLKVVYKLLVVFDKFGRAVAWNEIDGRGRPISSHSRNRLAGGDKYDQPWFREAMAGRNSRVDWHLDPLDVEDASAASTKPSDYTFAFSAPIRDQKSGDVVGAFYSLVGWETIQNFVLDPVSTDAARLPVSERYQSGYAFLWLSDADHIIGHRDRGLYGKLVSGSPVNLPQLSQSVANNPNGVVRYDYPAGTEKRAGFRQTLTTEQGGFGWIVGVTLEDEQVFAPARVVRILLTTGASIGIAGLLLWILVLSRAITRPLTELAAEADKIARGDLAARVDPAGPAETVALGRAFNHMAEEIARNREQLVRAEKELAWREMARQVSHEIKNPLTPMKLSISLVEKAWRDKSADFEEILQKSIVSIERQIESLRRIATDFKTFAGSPNRRREIVILSKTLDEVAALYSAQASQRNIKIVRGGAESSVLGDGEELRRAIVNLVDNALQAAPDGSRIDLTIQSAGGFVKMNIHDEGAGIPPAARAKLFTPYFSTRTHGTGLGLAIVRRIAEDHGGRAYWDEHAPSGTTMVIELPEAPAA